MAAPTITSITPNQGPAGTQATVVGTNLNEVTAMRVGGVSTPYVIVSSTQITFTLPTGITVGVQDVDFDYADTLVDSGAFTDTAATSAFAGIYQFGSSVGDTVPSSVKGLSFQVQWKDVNPSSGVYNWTPIESRLAYAHSISKHALLRVIFGSGPPAWVTSAVPMVTVSWTNANGPVTTHMPIPWDPTYLSHIATFIAAFGAQYDGDSRHTLLPCAGAGWLGEMRLPHPWSGWTSHTAPPNGCDGEPYTDTLLINAWKGIIDAWVAAFPTTRCTLAIDSGTGIPGTLSDDQIRTQIADHGIASGKPFLFQFNGLRASTSPNPADRLEFTFGGPGPAGSGAGVGCQQYIGNNTIPNLNTMFGVALDLGVHFVEVYKSDVQNPAAASALATLAAGLH